jgi:hypothetical protein
MSRLFNHVKVTEKLEILYTLTIDIFFAQILVSNFCSRFPKFVRTYLFPKICIFPLFYDSEYPKYVDIFTCSNVTLSTTILLLIETSLLNAVTLPMLLETFGEAYNL